MTGSHPPLEPREKRALEEFVQKVRERLGDNLVALKPFGSKATGRAAPDSDIDVLVAVNGADAAVEDQVLDVTFEVNVTHEVYISPRVVPGRPWRIRCGDSHRSCRRWKEKESLCDA